MQVNVRDNNIEQALRALKKKLQREGVFREMKLKQHFEKPSVKKAREKAEAVRRARKLARKKMIREGAFCKTKVYYELKTAKKINANVENATTANKNLMKPE